MTSGFSPHEVVEGSSRVACGRGDGERRALILVVCHNAEVHRPVDFGIVQRQVTAQLSRRAKGRLLIFFCVVLLKERNCENARGSERERAWGIGVSAEPSRRRWRVWCKKEWTEVGLQRSVVVKRRRERPAGEKPDSGVLSW